MVAFDTKSYSKKLLHLISWSHWFTFFNILAAIALSSYYLFSESAPTTFLGQAYLVTTWVSHIAFLTFMSFVLVLFPLTLILPNTKFIRTSGSIIFTIGLLLLVLDGFIYSRLGYHINASSSEQIISLLSDIAKENSLFYTLSGALAIIVLSFEFIVSNYAWKHLKQLQKTIFARFVISTLVFSFFFSHLTHIWADANLDYDILRQDTVLPLSYPATAKTLLTKYGLFNIEDYIERKNSPLSFSHAIPDYPVLDIKQCPAAINSPTNSVILVLNEQQVSATQLNQFIRRASATSLHLTNNIDTGLNDDAWFNLLYSLPSIYQEEILKQGMKPLLFQRMEQQSLATSLTVISDRFSETSLPTGEDNDIAVVEPRWFEALVSEKTELDNVSSLLFANKLNNKAPGLHIIYFKNTPADTANKAEINNNQYQFELFVDALLLAQKQKSDKDIIWISSIGNQSNETRLDTKPALFIYPQAKKVSHEDVSFNTSNMDLQPTLLSQWLGCHTPGYNNGIDLPTLNKDRVIANTTDKGIIIFDKDKSVFVDQHGNFQSYSRQFEAPITVNSDFPLMIDGVHFIKLFTSQKVDEIER
jgi:membrane-anchored protein YejM (alkaline phosphatase superfamily)